MAVQEVTNDATYSLGCVVKLGGPALLVELGSVHNCESTRTYEG